MNRAKPIVIGMALCAMLLAAAGERPAAADNYAFQFACIKDGDRENTIWTQWMDERLSNAVSFSRGRHGQHYLWARDDCGPYGLLACVWHPGIPYEWAWVEHLTALTCDEVCINIRDIDGFILPRVATHDIGEYTYPNRVIIRRYAIDLDHRYSDMHIRSTYSTWNLSDAEIAYRQSSVHGGYDQGLTYCWSEWTDNYWVASYEHQGLGRVTEVTFVDPEHRTHIFRVVPTYPEPSGW